MFSFSEINDDGCRLMLNMKRHEMEAGLVSAELPRRWRPQWFLDHVHAIPNSVLTPTVQEAFVDAFQYPCRQVVTKGVTLPT